MAEKITIATIEFKNFKALKNYSLRLEHMNILVGPNNSGKSTTISAFRALGVGIKQALSKKALMVEGPDHEQYGYPISEESLPMSLENVHTDYVDVDSMISFTLTNGNKLVLYFPKEGGCNLLTFAKGAVVNTPVDFKKHFPISLEIVPVLGPIEQNEQIVTIETVRKGLTTHRASRHFRNYWRFFPEGFEDFAELVRKTWSGMTIEAPVKADAMSLELIMFCNENRIPRELFWSGFGFQIWCQLLTHISRSKNATLLIVDEPEVYLHPDVQRQLLGILRYCGPDIIIASHSKEILEEADASEILLINKKKENSVRLTDIGGIQQALDILGSVQNTTLTHLARTGRLLFVEGFYDYKLIRRFAKQVGLNELSLGNDIAVVLSDGLSFWEQIKSFEASLNKNDSLHVAAIFDRDFWSDEEYFEIKNQLNQHLEVVHVYSKTEIENYLLDPKILEKALKRAINEITRRTGINVSESESILQILDRITIPLKFATQSEYLSKRIKFFEKSDISQLEIKADGLMIFENKWKELDTRLEIVRGKEVLKLLRAEIKSLYSVNLTDFKIIDEFDDDEIHEEIRELLNRLEKFRISN